MNILSQSWNAPFRFLPCTERRKSFKNMDGHFIYSGRHAGSIKAFFSSLSLSSIVRLWKEKKSLAKTNLIELFGSIAFFGTDCHIVTNLFFDIVRFESFMEFQTFWRSDCAFLWNAIWIGERERHIYMMIYVHSIAKFSFIGITILDRFEHMHSFGIADIFHTTI